MLFLQEMIIIKESVITRDNTKFKLESGQFQASINEIDDYFFIYKKNRSILMKKCEVDDLIDLLNGINKIDFNEVSE